jgi:hypothetical protein
MSASLRVLSLCSIAVAFFGCSVDPALLEKKSPSRWAHVEHAVAIQLVPSEPSTVTRFHSIRGEEAMPFVTGSIWRRKFVGTNNDPTFRIISARLDSTIEAAGFAGRETYTIDGELSWEARSIRIHATGSRAAAMNMGQAMRESVDIAVDDAATQCEAILRAWRSTQET